MIFFVRCKRLKLKKYVYLLFICKIIAPVKGVIQHTATVVAIEGTRVSVEMGVESACVSCSAKSACGVTEGGKKMAVVEVEDPLKYSVGERVMLYAGRAVGVKAVLIAYLFPFFVLIGTLLGLTAYGVDEIVAGCFSMGAMCLYFVLVLLLKKRIEKQIVLKITKIE